MSSRAKTSTSGSGPNFCPQSLLQMETMVMRLFYPEDRKKAKDSGSDINEYP